MSNIQGLPSFDINQQAALKAAQDYQKEMQEKQWDLQQELNMMQIRSTCASLVINAPSNGEIGWEVTKRKVRELYQFVSTGEW